MLREGQPLSREFLAEYSELKRMVRALWAMTAAPPITVDKGHNAVVIGLADDGHVTRDVTHEGDVIHEGDVTIYDSTTLIQYGDVIVASPKFYLTNTTVELKNGHIDTDYGTTIRVGGIIDVSEGIIFLPVVEPDMPEQGNIYIDDGDLYFVPDNVTGPVNVTGGGGAGWQGPVTLSFGAFSDTDTDRTISSGMSVPARSWLHGVVIKHGQAFGGGTIMSVVANVIVNGTTVATLDVFQATGDGIMETANESNMGLTHDVISFGSSTDIEVRLQSAGGNLDALTQGSLQVWAQITTLP